MKLMAFTYIWTSCKLTVMLQIKFPLSVSKCAKSKQVVVCWFSWSSHMFTYLSTLRLYPSTHMGVKTQLKLYLCIIKFHTMKIFTAGCTGSWPSRSNASRLEDSIAPDLVWTLRARETFLLLTEIKPRFLRPASGILVTVVNVLHNGMDA